MPLSITLLLVCIIGFLAQSIGLCMVRGVNEWKNGKPQFLLAILFSGTLAWIAMLYSAYIDSPTQFRIYETNTWFVLGGLIFGFGTAFNQGCGVSTLSKLSRGDTKMIFTIIGWLVGWTILAVWVPQITHNELVEADYSNRTIGLLAGLTIALFIWALTGSKEHRTLWLSIMTIGLIGGFVLLFDTQWPLSGLLHKISHAMTKSDMTLLPLKESYFILLSLLIGMFTAAWHTKRFKLVSSNWQQWLLHILAGSFMGVGASLAHGGNDTQLLLALPALTPAGFTAILSMVAGIWIGLHVRGKFFIKLLT